MIVVGKRDRLLGVGMGLEGGPFFVILGLKL